jgi:hypothetical protein
MVYNYFIIIFLMAALTGFGAESEIVYFLSDTVKISSIGKQNQIVVDSVEIIANTSDSLALPFNGQLLQTGQANKIEISTKPGSTKPDNSKSKITITQTGNNNKVKINSQ